MTKADDTREQVARSAADRFQATTGLFASSTGGRVVIRVSPDEADVLRDDIALGRTARDVGQPPDDMQQLMFDAADRAVALVAKSVNGDALADPVNVDEGALLILAGAFAQYLRQTFTHPANQIEPWRRTLYSELGGAAS